MRQYSNQSEAELTLGLLRAVEHDQALTQRSAARELGVALGLVNTYLKRCVKKGLIKMSHAPSSRYIYYLTPKGFAEKSRLTAEFLSQSLSLFRQAQGEYEGLLEECVENGWSKIALCGISDLTEIVALYARDFPLTIVGVIDPDAKNDNVSFFQVFETCEDAGKVDAFIVTALKNSQAVYDDMVLQVPSETVLTPNLLEILRSTDLIKRD